MAGGASPTKGQIRWDAHRRAFEEYLHGLNFTVEPRLSGLEEAMRYSLLAGGKRVRPALCMETAWIFGAEPSHVLPSAAAIELIHTYSLIHDDLPAMDDDDYRRGRPTAHKKFGEAMAILAGDAFFGEALTLITVHQRGSCEEILEVVRELADSTGVNGMVGGQVLDMDHTGLAGATEPETLYMIHEYKTGALIKSSARIGAILAGATGEEQAAVSEYASQLGLCFQIVDDVLNATSTREELGKSAGSDAEQGKATFAGVFGLKGARQEADEAARRAITALSRVDGDTSGLQELAYFVRHRES
ncbi:MAG: polyprenyl synthetase family protein [Actinomycetota bacterium]|nr:polyprenyl synthetase family protein [Actinomycetota bacterium]